jgi:hypothetical protein
MGRLRQPTHRRARLTGLRGVSGRHGAERWNPGQSNEAMALFPLDRKSPMIADVATQRGAMSKVIVGAVIFLGDDVTEARVNLPGPSEVHATIALSSTRGGEMADIESFRYQASNGKIADATHRRSFLTRDNVTSILFRLQLVNPPPGRGASPVATYTIHYRVNRWYWIVGAIGKLVSPFVRRDGG